MGRETERERKRERKFKRERKSERRRGGVAVYDYILRDTMNGSSNGRSRLCWRCGTEREREGRIAA